MTPIKDLDKLKTEVMSLKMFVTDQLYLFKQSVGNLKTPECNYNRKSGIYIKSIIEQIHYLKEENKMKNSFIQFLLFQNSYTTVPNDLFLSNDKVNETSPASNDDHIFDDIEDTKDEDKPVVYMSTQNQRLEKLIPSILFFMLVPVIK